MNRGRGRSRGKAALWHFGVVFGRALAAKRLGRAARVNLDAQISWQAQHFVADLVAGAAGERSEFQGGSPKKARLWKGEPRAC